MAIKTDLRNVRPQQAIERLGAQCEGVWRNHRILSTSRYHDRVFCSVIDSEWPSIRDKRCRGLADCMVLVVSANVSGHDSHHAAAVG